MAPERRSPCPEGRTERRRAAKADSATLEDQCHPRKVFIGGLAHKTTTQQLRDYFVRYGAIVDAVVLRWPDGRSRGFGYVTFSEANSASAVLRVSHQVGGRQVDVKRAVPGTNKLFVGGLPQNTAAAELREHFEVFGVVSDAVVMIDPATNRSRGFGFVCFLPGQEGATAVAAALEQYEHHRIRGKWIEVKSAAPPHKLAAKDGALTPDGQLPPAGALGSCEVSITAAERTPAPVGPQTCARPVATPHRSQGAAVSKPTANGSAPFEPRKVALPGTTTATMAAAIAAMGTPPGLGMPARAKESTPPPRAATDRAAPAPVSLSCRLPWPPVTAAVSAQPPWPGCLSLPSEVFDGAPPLWSAADGGHARGFDVAEDAAAPGMGGFADVWGTSDSMLGRSGLFATSEGLQKSLEQLLRQQSQRIIEAEERGKGTALELPVSCGRPTTQADEAASPSTTDRHGG